MSLLVRISRWSYARATALLPSPFRAEYGAEMEECFARITEDAGRRGPLAVLVVTASAIGDVLARALVERLRRRTTPRGPFLSAAWEDLRQARRRLSRRPGFALVSIGTLAVGFASVATVFSLVYGVVLRPLPYPDSGRIVNVDHGGPGLGVDRGLGITYGFYRFYAERLRGVAAIAMYSRIELTLTGAGDPVRVEAGRATPSLEGVLGIRPALGRWFRTDDVRSGAAPVAVLSYRLWRDRFGADPRVPGRHVELDGVAHEVVGILPEGFTFPDEDVALWTPRAVPTTGIGGWNALAVARLAPGVQPGGLEGEIRTLYTLLRETTDDRARVGAYLDDARIMPVVVPLKDSIVGDVRDTLWILMGSVGAVLLIAVANVANLFLVRGDDRRREGAVRRALGASESRLTRAALVEALLVTGIAAAVGLTAAAGGVRVLRQRAPVNIPRLDEVGLDGTVVAVVVASAMAIGLVLGLLSLARGEVGASLREGTRRATAGRSTLRGRNLLVGAQVALALTLLIASGLLFRTFRELNAVDPGFTTREALVFDVGVSPARYRTSAEAAAFQERLLGELAALPGVERAAAVGRCLPLVGYMCWGETLEADGRPTPDGEVAPVTGIRLISPDYFTALGISVRGRAFGSGDADGAPRVAVLSEAAAAAYFPGEDALGRRVRFGAELPWHTVVGVAHDVRGRVETDDFQRLVYLPLAQEVSYAPPPTLMAYALSTSVPPASLLPAVRRTLAALDPTVPLAAPRTMRQLIASATAPTSFALVLVGLAAVTALLLGAVGLYAVVAYAVSRRTAEIGVRMALGARAADVRRMVLLQGAAVVGAGSVVGIGAALALSRLFEGMLFGVSATDPGTYAAVTAVLLSIAALALYLPARRAARVDPVEALRRE